MKTLLALLLLPLSAVAQTSIPLYLPPPVNPTYRLTLTPVKCPEQRKCNTLHVRFVRPDGTMALAQDIPVEEQVSNILIEIITHKGTVTIWSDR